MRADLRNQRLRKEIIEILKRFSQLTQKDCDPCIQDSCPLANKLLSPIVKT